MLPQTPYPSTRTHESINDLPVHRATLHQLFVPTSESRAFTRRDAGKVFHRALRPADERIPHPDMIDSSRDTAEGLSISERSQRKRARWDAEEAARQKKVQREVERDARNTTVVPGQRWDFVFKGMDAEAVAGRTGRDGAGVDGRGMGVSPAEGGIVSGLLRGMGRKRGEPWRYGVPREDRKKGMVKIAAEMV